MEMREQSNIDEKQQQQQHPILYFKGKKARDFPAVARKTATVVYKITTRQSRRPHVVSVSADRSV
jgi:hypothetical protein